MTRVVEAALAGAAALALHLAGFALWGWNAPLGAEAAGAGGTALVTIAPADGALQAVIADWERPPQVAEDAPPAQPAKLDSAPQIAPLDPAPSPAVAVTTPKPSADTAPVAQTETPPTQARPPATKPQARSAQVAAGEGGGAAAGDGGQDAAATANEGEQADARLAWGATIRAKIEARKSYPRDGRGAKGTVTLRLSVAGDGRLVLVEVAESSGSAALDRAAVLAVRQAGRFARAPAAIGADGARFTLPITFAP